MRLVHFSAEPLTEIHAVEQPIVTAGRWAAKPSGLWVSDEDTEQSWSKWCADENYSPERLVCATEIVLAPDARLLMLRTADDIDEFTRRYSYLDNPSLSYWVGWPEVAARHQGILITPYVWGRRLSDASWYYPWDCASGCIWDPAAIASFTAIESVQP